MPNYPQPEKFQASQETLNQWLKTRKNENDGNPGFFSSTGFSKDQSWTTLAIIIEFIALTTTLFGSYVIYQSNGKVGPIILAVSLVLFFIVFDIVGVFLHNNDKGERAKNRIRLILEDNPAIRDLIRSKINSQTPREIMALFLFLMSALLKIYAVMQFIGGMGNITLAIILTLFYLVVVYIHTCHTGYWLSERKTQREINREYNLWVESLAAGEVPSSNSTQSVVQFRTLVPMSETSHQNGRQSIRFISQETQTEGYTHFEYELKSQGTLLDDDIVQLSAAFQEDFKRPLIYACLDMQLNQVGIIT
ncbi:hypothetical protein OAI90_10050 [Crocinitomicaceae bacterium]|jgi:hypothetical protein|nr:hypothetical protein [Crocinitomicaceae bacterium]|tara:strand:+ start:104 stop:1021 length:918 start_codon:yes stop_codon:yes gene_type:complete